MRNRNTLEFLGAWRMLYYPTFKGVEFDPFLDEAGGNRFNMISIRGGVYQTKKGKDIIKPPNKLLTFTTELFGSIVLQNAEMRTVINSLPLEYEHLFKSLFPNRLYQDYENVMKFFSFSQFYFVISIT